MLDAIAGYLLERETITGAQMMAILEGKDPDQAEDQFGSGTPARPAVVGDVEPPAKNIHMVSEPIEAPKPPEEGGPSDLPENPELPDLPEVPGSDGTIPPEGKPRSPKPDSDQT